MCLQKRHPPEISRCCRGDSILTYVGLSRGDLVRWIVDYETTTQKPDESFEVAPLYAHGVIVDISSDDTNNVIIACFDHGGSLVIRHMLHDGFEVVSEG